MSYLMISNSLYPFLTRYNWWRLALPVICFTFSFLPSNAQSVSQIITDYNGWWKSANSSVSPVRPDNHHHLLAFTFNGTTYSTGVNNGLLSAHGETFVSGQYQALPLQNVNGTVNSNTKIGLGAMADGVYNGAGAAPSRNLGPYLNDGTNGLNLGTCVANLPAGTMFMSVSNVQAAKIGDGVPDIVVTQIADPSTSYDSYEFTDVNGTRVGNSLDVVLNNIPSVGNWVADFYEATGSTVLATSFTQTQRAIRLWAADFSLFGLNASNIGSIAYFKTTLSGTSDIAFVAYNTSAITVEQVLDLSAATPRLRPSSRRDSEVSEMVGYPNPASTGIELRHPNTDPNDRISIYTYTGTLIRQVSCTERSTKTWVNLFGLPKGSYQAMLTGARKKLSFKFIIQ